MNWINMLVGALVGFTGYAVFYKLRQRRVPKALRLKREDDIK